MQPAAGSDAMPNVRPFRGVLPRLGARVYIDPTATVIGDVDLGDDVSIWPGAVLRGDMHQIRVGTRSNVQDGSVVHITGPGPYTGDGFACIVGSDVVIGHAAVIHACTIGDACLIGMHATILDGAVVHTHAFIGAGALVAPGKVVGTAELWVGNPARCVRHLSEREIEAIEHGARHYVELKDEYLAALS